LIPSTLIHAHTATASASSLEIPPLAQALCLLFDPIEHLQFWIKDRDGRYQWANRGFLLNYSLDRVAQAIGKTDFDLSPPEIANAFRMDDERVLNGDVIVGRTERVGRYDDCAVWCITHKVPLRDAAGKICGTAGITLPLSEGNRAEVKDEELNLVVAYIHKRLSARLTNEELAGLASMSVRAFERRFSVAFGTSPQQYIRRLRVRLASQELANSARPLKEVAAAFGFADQSHFTREFRRETSLTPAEFRRRLSSAASVLNLVAERPQIEHHKKI
jgi:AraC-like DNA-binding protein